MMVHIITMFRDSTGLFLTTYCVGYAHAVPFLRSEIPFSLLKTPETHAV